MKKTLLYRLFRLGAIPKKVLPVLEGEGIVISDEGMGGWFIAKNVKGPGKRFVRRSEGLSACLVITKKRVISYTYHKRQINIAIDDPRISHLYFTASNDTTLSISFESSVFQEGWEGVIEFRFKTEKASQFLDVLTSIGAQKGHALDGSLT